MKHKIIGYALALGMLLSGFMIMKKMIASKEQPEKKEVVPTVKVVKVFTANPSENAVKIPINGKLESFNKVELFSEVGGRMLRGAKDFKEGVGFGAGEILLSIDARDTRAALVAQRSSFQTILTQILPDLKLDHSENFQAWNQYLVNFDPEKSVPELPKTKTDKEKRFLTTKNVYNTFYNIKSQELKLSKFTIYAPFSGVLSMANIQYGSIIRPGQKLGDFIQPGMFEVEAPVNIKDITYLRNGDVVTLKSNDLPGEWKGKINRIGKNVDAKTQSVMVYIGLNNPDLKEGMYLGGEIVAGKISGSVVIARKLLNQDGSVYAVVDNELRKVVPKIEKMGESSVIVSNIEQGTQLITENFIGAYEGLKVNIAQ